MRRIAALIGALAVVSALLVGVSVGPAGAGGGLGAKLAISPDPAHPGDTVTIGNADGSECEGGLAEFEVMFGTDIITEQRFIETDANGDWSRSVELAPDAEAGIYEVEAECLGDAPAAPQFPAPFEYDEADFEVVVEGADVFTFTATPDSGLPGSSVHVSGEFCSPGLGDAVVVTFTLPDDEPEFDPAVDTPVGVFTVGPPDASYAGDFEVPDVEAGDYQVNGFCVGEGGQPILEPLFVPFEVLAEAVPPTPVPEPPTFTG